MPTVQVPAQLTVKHLLAAVKQLSRDELRDFLRQVAKCQEQHSRQAGAEAPLLARIHDHLGTHGDGQGDGDNSPTEPP